MAETTVGAFKKVSSAWMIDRRTGSLTGHGG